mgnify:CR=1 FL=1
MVTWHNEAVAKKNHYVDHGWPEVEGDEHAVTELTAHLAGALSPFGNEHPFPMPADELPYVHAKTVINR